METLVEGRDFGRGHPREHAGRGFEHGDFQAALDGDGGDLEADIAAADDDEAPARGKLRPQQLDIRDGAQIKDIAEAGSWSVDPARPAPGGEDELVPGGGLAAIERQPPRAAVDRGDAPPEAQFDVGLFIGGLRLVDQRIGA